MAAAGVCSRRDAERLIEEGAVMLNGKPVTTPATLVTPRDVITVYGEKVKRTQADAPRLFIYHKPPGLLTTHKDTHGRDTVFEHLPKHLPRVVSVGRLDANSEGLLLLTTSGALAREMELPDAALARVYRVRASGRLSPDALARIERGISIEGVHYQGIEIFEENEKSGRNQWYELTLREGKNREIRRIFQHFDLHVSRLIRVAYGSYQLGNLKRGEVREVSLDSE
jgi:23S rRNA pseudouridine2605 synthase